MLSVREIKMYNVLQRYFKYLHKSYLVRHEQHIFITRKAWSILVDIKKTWRTTVKWRNSCDAWKIKARCIIRTEKLHLNMNMNLTICVVKIENFPCNELVVNLPYRIFYNLLSASLLYSAVIVAQRPDIRAWHYMLRYVKSLQEYRGRLFIKTSARHYFYKACKIRSRCDDTYFCIRRMNADQQWNWHLFVDQCKKK